MSQARTLSALAALAATLFTASAAAQGTAAAATATATVAVENPLAVARPDEVVAIPWTTVTRAVPAATADAIRVRDGGGRFVMSQVLDLTHDGTPDSLLFIADLGPNDRRVYTMENAPAPRFSPRVHIRHDAPRDDIAWENDRVAFRMYGQGLKLTPSAMSSSGIDVWPKRTHDLILEKWYGLGHDAYHVDRGEGADFFDVGTTLGVGGTAVWRGDSLNRADNFDRYRILADGPIRAVVEADYDTWNAAGLRVTETKRITIDPGQHLYRSESVFRSSDTPLIPIATGVVKRKGMVGTMSKAQPWAWLTGWGPVDRKNGGHGELGTAVMLPVDAVEDWKELDDHYVALATARSGVPVVQFVGFGWTASDFPTPQSWWTYLDATATRLATPLRVTVDP